MRHLILVIALALPLGGCFLTAPLVEKNTLYGVQNSYGILLSAAVAYRQRPLCTKIHPFSVANLCAKYGVIQALQAADKKAQVALASGNALASQNALMAFQTILRSNGVQ